MDRTDDRHECRCKQGISRRGFLRTMGIGSVAVAAAGHVRAAPPERDAPLSGEEMAKIVLKINGQERRLLVEPRWTLLFILREKLGLTGTKVGCERGECGACTVLVDGVPRYACMILAPEAEGREITTLEGLLAGEELGPVQQAFLEHDAYQCGYCTPGQIMAVEGLLRANPDPTLDEVRRGVSGNLCRCGAYNHIFAAAQRAAELKRAGGGS
ncbi:MAG: 2Fe-2S iron-sulfur cluster binding domain-containing protein [Candidatus Eisenbacteria bacterium]|nr:2Fe-2S iron-sulfur cluster binding domain-containing protein [Candidatus Eisenbacteria bacterium]